MNQVEDLAKGLLSGQRRALAKAITLVESQRDEDRDMAEKLLNQVMPKSGGSIRVGISGSPGVGKSTFIESFGKLLVQEGKKVAVLAVDPSSPITGGSILGDKTRMEDLVKSDEVFIRPSPSQGSLGGVSRRTREAIILCEAAGYDYVLVETVGVGQSEIAVSSMVDIFLVLQLPNSGDELQGIKKGILEKADIVVITKADGPSAQSAERARLEHVRALQLVRTSDAWHPPVLATSSVENLGLTEVRAAITDCHAHLKKQGLWERRRDEQAKVWFEQELLEGTKEWLAKQTDLSDRLKKLEDQVIARTKPASAAVRELFTQISARA